MCDNSVGVLFNDNTRIVLHEDAVKCQYVDKDYNEQFFTIDNYPSELKKKVSLVKYFRNYMNEHLLKVSHFLSTVQVVAYIWYTSLNSMAERFTETPTKDLIL